MLSILAEHKFYHSKKCIEFSVYSIFTRTAPGADAGLRYRFYNVQCEWTFQITAQTHKNKELQHAQHTLEYGKDMQFL